MKRYLGHSSGRNVYPFAAIPDGAQEIYLSETLPVDISKIKLGICSLPYQKIAELLSSCSNHQVRLLTESQAGFYRLFVYLLLDSSVPFPHPGEYL